MDKVQFNYSLKNIPIPSRRSYLLSLLNKVENFIKRLRWKAFFFDTNDHNAENNCPTYGFKTDITPPQHDDLKLFEQDMFNMVRDIQFKPVSNSFQSLLSTDAKKIYNTPNVIVPADKTSNFYKMEASNYKKLLLDNVSSKYKKVNPTFINDINVEAKSIATNLKLDNRIEQFSSDNAFITIKDHKPNFPNNIK